MAKRIKTDPLTPDLPCRAARCAIAILGHKLGVQGNDDERLESVEVWDHDDPCSSEPVLELP